MTPDLIYKIFRDKFPDIAEKANKYTNDRHDRNRINIYTDSAVYTFRLIGKNEYELKGRY